MVSHNVFGFNAISISIPLKKKTNCMVLVRYQYYMCMCKINKLLTSDWNILAVYDFKIR